MNQWVLPTIAVLLLGYGALSGRLQSTVVTQAMVFVALGLLVGNRVLGLVEVDAANQFVRHLAEATLALVLFTDAARVNLGTLRREAALPARLLGLGLPLTIVAGTLAGLVLFPQLDLWTAAALATILAPTDAALGLPVALALLGTGMRRVTVGFLGWFGPRGLASIVFVLILVEETELPERSLMLTVVTWTVALSVYAHGLSAWPGANRYADWYAAHHRDHGSMPESVPTTEKRVRVPALRRQSSGPT
jgi:NhaP-type Na+/H+ or K+/H+ antiporter